MKLSNFVFVFVVLSLVGCSDQKQSQSSENQSAFDFTGYEKQELQNGLVRVYRKDANGQISEEGYLVDGRKTGVWTTYTSDRIETVTSYVNGIKNGKQLEFDFRRQVIEEATWVNNKLHGKTGSYKFGRPIVEAYYVDGQMHGPYRKYFETGKDQGKINQYVDYVHGVIDGKVRYYNAAGEVTVEYNYKNGEKIGGGMSN